MVHKIHPAEFSIGEPILKKKGASCTQFWFHSFLTLLQSLPSTQIWKGVTEINLKSFAIEKCFLLFSP